MLALLLTGVLSPVGYVTAVLYGICTAWRMTRLRELDAPPLGLPPHLDHRFTRDAGPGA